MPVVAGIGIGHDGCGSSHLCLHCTPQPSYPGTSVVLIDTSLGPGVGPTLLWAWDGTVRARNRYVRNTLAKRSGQVGIMDMLHIHTFCPEKEYKV